MLYLLQFLLLYRPSPAPVVVPAPVISQPLRRSGRNLPVPIVGLVILEAASSPRIARSVNSDGVVQLSPLASPFVPQIATSPSLIRLKSGEISLVSTLSSCSEVLPFQIDAGPPFVKSKAGQIVRVPVVSSQS